MFKMVSTGHFWTFYLFITCYVVGDRPELFKCSDFSSAEVVDYIEIPPTLRIPYPPDIIEKYSDTLGSNIFNFTLNPKNQSNEDFSCKEGDTKRIQLFTANNYTAGIDPAKKKSVQHVYSNTLHYFTAFGFLKSKEFYFQPKHYCISNFTEEAITLNLCMPQNYSSVQFIRKCCPLGMTIYMNLSSPGGGKTGCRVSTTEWEPFLYKSLQDKMYTNHSDTLDYKYKSLGKSDKCRKVANTPFQGGGGQHFVEERELKILENGGVYTRVSGNHAWEVEKEDSFCVDGLFDVSSSSVEFQRTELNQVVLRCTAKMDKSESVYAKIYFAGLCTSTVFSLMTVVAYVLIWNQQNVHGWTIAIFCLCLALHSLFAAMGHAYGLWGVDFEGTRGCVAVGILAHFFYIATFSWLTCVNFDLYLTLKSMTPLSGRSKGKKLFGMYNVFAFSVPTIVVTISGIIETQFGFFDDTVIRPQYGRVWCLLDKSAALYHGVVVNSIILGLNCVLVLLTLKTLLWDFRTKGQQNIRSTKRSQNQGILLCRLFVVMGISWFFEILSWFVSGAKVTWYWAIFDGYNLIQPALLFILFVWRKKDIRQQLQQRFSLLRVGLTTFPLTSTSGNHGQSQNSNATATTSFS